MEQWQSSGLAAVNAIDKRDIMEVKSFSKPPAMSLKVQAALNVALNGPSASAASISEWPQMKRCLADIPAFLERLRNFDPKSLSAESAAGVRAILDSGSTLGGQSVVPITAENANKVSAFYAAVVVWLEALLAVAVEDGKLVGGGGAAASGGTQ